MNVWVIEVIYITRSWSPFTSICHPTLGSLCSWAISPGALFGGEGGARAARRPRRGRRLRPVMPPWLAPAPRANGPAAETSDVALPRGGVSCGISGKSELTRLSNRCRIQDGPRLPRGGRLLVATLWVALAHALGPANANTSGSCVSAQSTLAHSHCPPRWGFACNLFGAGVRKCWWRAAGDTWQLLPVCRRS